MDFSGQASRRRRRVMLWAIVGLAAGILGGWLFMRIMPAEYTTEAWLRVIPGQIPERFVPSPVPLNAALLVHEAAPVLRSRNSLANLISTYDLYPAERALLPLEDVIESMTPKVVIEAKDSGIEIKFTYRNPDTSMKVTRDLMTRLLDDTIRQRSSASKMTTEFLKEQVNDAARDWDERAHVATMGGGSDPRAQLDRELARQRYERLVERLAESQMITDVETRKQGPTLEVLELPIVPERRDPVLGLTAAWIIGLAGTLGLVMGALLGRFGRNSPLPAPPPVMLEAEVT